MRKILLAGCCCVAMMVSGAGLGQTPSPAPVSPPAAPAAPTPIVPPAAPPPATSSADERARDDRARMEAEDRTSAEERARAAEGWIADRADAELAQLKVRLRLSGEQDAQWSGFQAAMRDMMIAEGRARHEWEMRRSDDRDDRRRDREERRSDIRDDRRFGDGEDRRAGDRAMRDQRPDEIAALREEADSMTRRADNLRKIADAADPLYRTLDDRQRQRLMRFLSASLH